MRSDFLGDCTEFKGLPEAINNSQYLVPRMTREEIRIAVAGPIAVGGAEISPPLLSRLLNDVGDNPDQLPILQHALMRTWDYWVEKHREGEPLGLEHYQAIGTMASALSQHAEETYAELRTEKSRAICEKMFKLLTQKGEKGRGVRRPAKVSEICSVTDASEKEVIKVINVFRQPGRTFLMPPSEISLNADPVIDISHESLMRIWTRLIGWVREEEESAELYLRLARAAALHEEEKAGLWRDPDLMLALKWRAENKPNTVWAQRYDPAFDRATRFLESGKEQQKREMKEKEKLKKIKTMTLFLIIISIAAAVSISFAIWALKSEREALRLKDIAEEAKREAVTARNSAEEQRDKAVVEKEKAAESEKEAKTAKKNAEESAKDARMAKIEAEKNQTKAEKEKRKAEEKELKARIQGLIIEMNKENETFRQGLAKAKELAVQSTAQTGDKDLKALLALAAYQLNLKAYEHLARSTRENFAAFDKKTLDRFAGKKELVEAYKRSEKRYVMLQKKSKEKLVPAEIFGALRIAYIAGEDSEDIIYKNTESWALAAVDNNIVFNNREGELLIASLQSQSNDSKLPGLKDKVTHRLLGNTRFQPSSFVDTKDRLFCGTMKGGLIYWEKSKWKEKRLPVKHDAKILAMAFSKNKNCLVYSVKNMICVHPLNLKDAPEAFIPFEKDNFVRALTVIEDPDPEHSILIAGDAKGNIFHYNLLTGIKERKRLNTDFESNGFGFHSIAYNPAGKLLALSNSRGEILLFPGIHCKSLMSGTKIRSYTVDKTHKGIVKALLFSPGGRYLASGGLDGTVMLWDLKGKKAAEIARQVPLLTFHDKRKMKVLSLVFDPGGEYIIFNDKQNLRICPTRPKTFYEKLCKRKKRELRKDEWKLYIGESIKQEDIIICPTGKRKGEKIEK
jgi:WD40 repeat protein